MSHKAPENEHLSIDPGSYIYACHATRAISTRAISTRRLSTLLLLQPPGSNKQETARAYQQLTEARRRRNLSRGNVYIFDVLCSHCPFTACVPVRSTSNSNANSGRTLSSLDKANDQSYISQPPALEKRGI